MNSYFEYRSKSLYITLSGLATRENIKKFKICELKIWMVGIT